LRHAKCFMTEEDRWVAYLQALAAVSGVDSDTIAALRIIYGNLSLARRESPSSSTGLSSRGLLP
jgi:hypothetical protein